MIAIGRFSWNRFAVRFTAKHLRDLGSIRKQFFNLGIGGDETFPCKLVLQTSLGSEPVVVTIRFRATVLLPEEVGELANVFLWDEN
jgi:hypothetical protein